MNVGICDDSEKEREQLKDLLFSHSPDYKILEYPSGESLLAGLINGETLDLLFLDIYMTGINGIETAEQIRRTHKNLPIIFLTTSTDFALSAFGVRAIGYLLKPVNQNQLKEYLQDFTPAPQPPDTWQVISGHKNLSISIKQIVYWEQRGNYGELHMENGAVYPLRMTFAEISKHLEAYANISPCGKSYLVNLSFVRTLNPKEVLLENGTKLPVPRRAYQIVRQNFLNFYKGGA